MLTVLQEEILASTEEYAAPVPCKDKKKLLLEICQWLSDLKESQAAGSPHPKRK